MKTIIMRNIKVLLIASISVWIYSCENDTNNENRISCFQVNLNDISDYQIERKWTFLGFIYTDSRIENCIPDNVKEMNIEFIETNRFHAMSSCNTFDGYYSVLDSDSLKIDSVITTLKYCINDTVMDWEEKYFDELKNATSYKINGNRLTIETISNIDMVFRAD